MGKFTPNSRIEFDLEQHPNSSDLPDLPSAIDAAAEQKQPITRSEKTLHEGTVRYHKYWNFFVRMTTHARDQDFARRIFPDYENRNQRTFDLISAIGTVTRAPQSEYEAWGKIATVWRWLSSNVSYDSQVYTEEMTDPSWPSIDQIAKFYEIHGHLVWSACFSRAHLFATILGRIMPRWRVCVANANHTGSNNEYPPTATHVFVAVYVADRWFYLDPTAVGAVPELPGFFDRASVGYPTFTSVDYEHPYQVIPLPASSLTKVPLLRP